MKVLNNYTKKTFFLFLINYFFFGEGGGVQYHGIEKIMFYNALLLLIVTGTYSTAQDSLL